MPDHVDEGPDTLASGIESARAMMREHGAPAALPLWQEVCAAFPDDAEGHVGYGDALREAGQFDKAELTLSDATARFPAYLWGWVGHARIATDRQEWEEASRRWQEVCRRFPDQSVGYAGSGEALHAMGRFDEAEATLLVAVRRFPEDLWASVHYAVVAERRENWIEALGRWEAVRTRFPASPQGYIGVGSALSALGRADEAEAALAVAVERFPNDYWALVHHGAVASGMHRWDAAAERWARVREKFPDESRAYEELIAALLRHDRVEEAGAVLADALHRWPSSNALMRLRRWADTVPALKREEIRPRAACDNGAADDATGGARELIPRLKRARSRLDIPDSELLDAFWRHHPRWKFFKNLPDDSHLVDLGAGEGGLAHWKTWGEPQRTDLRLYGVDRRRGAYADLYDGWEALDLDEELPQFAGVPLTTCYSTHLIEHLKQPDRLVAWIGARLPPGGRCYVEWPSPSTTGLPTSQELLAAGFDVGPANFYDDSTHIAPPDPEQVGRILRDAGVDIRECGIIDLGSIAEELFLRGPDRGARTMGFWCMSGWCAYVVAEKSIPAHASGHAAADRAAGRTAAAGVTGVDFLPAAVPISGECDRGDPATLRPNFLRLLGDIARFGTDLRQLKESMDVDFRWYPHDTLANFFHIDPLITGELDRIFESPKHFADIGGADGDLAFFLEANGHRCDIYDYGLTNMNGLRGAAAVKIARESRVNIFDVDLDSQLSLAGGYDAIFLMGILYHLKNPYYILETCAHATKYLFLSTRIARHFVADGPDLANVPAAYLLGPAESNNDATNYWIFTDAGLRRVIDRSGWNILGYRTVGAADSNPQDADKDQRAFALLQSRTYDRRPSVQIDGGSTTAAPPPESSGPIGPEGERGPPGAHNAEGGTARSGSATGKLAAASPADPILAFYGSGGERLGPVLSDFFSSLPSSRPRSELCNIMTAHGSDKGSGWHNYTQLYDLLFRSRRETVRGVFEMGIGTNNPELPSTMGANGRPGASLRGWREYFPAATIVGADIDKRILFSDDRIATYYVDQRDPNAIDELWAAVPYSPFDLIIDDGLHIFEANSLFMQQSFGNVAPGGFYIIEDIIVADANLQRFDEFFRTFRASGALITLPNPVNHYDNCLAIFIADGQAENRAASSFGGWEEGDDTAPEQALADTEASLRAAVAAAVASVRLRDPGAAAAAEGAIGGTSGPAAFQGAARTLWRAGHRDAADAILDAAMHHFPAELWLAVEYAIAGQERADLAEARRRWARVIDKFPAYPAGYSGMGHALIAAGEIERADTILARALEAFPDDLWVAVQFARAAALRQDWIEACRRWEIVRSRHPDNPFGWEQTGETLKALGKVDEAKDVLHQATERFPGDENLRILYEEVACRHRSWPEAHAAWTVFQRQFPAYRSTNRERRVKMRQQVALMRPLQQAAAARIVALADEQWAVGTVISEDPVIILSCETPFHGARFTGDYYRDRPVYYLSGMTWSIAGHEPLKHEFAEGYRWIRAAYPNMRPLILANDSAELQTLRALSIPAELVNHNAFIDERSFTIRDDVPRLYDAVYNARASAYKRHSLATDIAKLLLVIGGWPRSEEVAWLRGVLPNAEIANLRDGSFFNLEPNDLARTLNSARCGLCLSAVEGAMLASVEYLLCGLPVVNTANSGGRDWFFSPEYVFPCEDNPESVRQTVQQAVSRTDSREFRESIRSSTIQKIVGEREKFYSIVNEIFRESGQPNRRIEDEFAGIFVDKLNTCGRPLGQFLVP
jgi:tetratricopeptide (TPR) repeat protein/2-polyprenyl-3-methyl-5-hydroxy-6-metoxy-1,4-benzoquinol methylase